ncbi:dynein heavy chain, cytoplasmic isoform X5 [Nasonia vitripennis]|uniref:Dynein heavy chain, cytoplasmic n=1 Tax=Nasonia vitripennis TaxID=7425 RepID=A0A7M7QLG4_NASVI|nr:dynein heavy chain, cytoplasmic isoform X5 [Nasonia vitripennis]
MISSSKFTQYIMMGDSLDSVVDSATETQNSSIVDFSTFSNYLRKAVCVLHPDEDAVPCAFNIALEDKNNQEYVRKFLSDPQVWALHIQRISNKEDDSGETDDEKENILYYISNEICFTSAKMVSIVFTKRSATVEADKTIHSQLRLIFFSDGSPYETLHAISKTMAPYFKSYVKEKSKIDRDGDKMAPSVEKKIAELEMGLLHLQQNIDIPEISLPIHPAVQQIIKQCSEEGRKPKVSDFGSKVEDSTFLNQLQNGVNRWIKEIQKVTKLNRDPESGTALQEISFWLNLERALHRIQEKRESIEISLTLDILKHGKRFHATVSFDTDTGLKQALATVNDYNPLMKDFPINDLLSATELERIRSAIQQIFIHLRKIRNTKYPIQRVLRLVEAISRDLGQQLLKVLGTRRLMHIPFEDFEKVMTQCFELFNTWDDEYDKLTQLLREVVKRKRDEHMKMVWRVSPAHKKLQTRMEHMRRFRRQHEQLRTVIVRVLRPVRQTNTSSIDNNDSDVKLDFAFDAADANAISEVNLAYENVKEVDCLDITKEGLESWEAAVNRYEERIERVEARITAHLRDQLGTAKNANEMFRIFSRFNALFVRPHIRGAIREYQTQLIQRVKDDIETLHEKFKVQYAQSKCYKMSMVRDLPPIAGSIIWVKQIDFQLTMYLRRVEDVLGKGWENHIEGQKLKADGDSFRMKLSTQEIFDEWARKVQQRNIGVTGRIFTIESIRSRSGRGNILKLKVNFLPEIITLSKEVRNLKNLGFRVPIAIVNKAHQANLLYPFAISLIESIRTYERTLEKARLQSSRYQVGLDKQESSTYRNLLTKLPSGKNSLEAAYDAIEFKMDEIVSYVDQWLRYQSLWDLQPENLYGKLNEDISLWMKCLNDIKKTRTTFDTSDTRREFGPVIIDFAKVQSKVSLKYDSWHKETLGKFGSLLGNEMASFHVQVSRSRSDLESHSIEAASTSDAVSFITYVQSLKRKMKVWEKQVNIYRDGQRILERQRFQFPSQWLHVDNIEGEWGAFNEIIKRKDTCIQTQVASLQLKIVAEDKAIETRTCDFLNDWEQGKPVEGHLRPDDALQQLQLFENKYTRLKEERDNVAKAKEALELLEPGVISVNEDRMQVVFEELQDLKGVWSELSKIWTQIDETREKPWLSVQPRKLRLQLDTMLTQLKELPARLRQYSSYEYVKKLLQNYTKVNMLIVELKSDALKERHWKLLMKHLRVDWLLSELTLGQVWDVNLQKNEGAVKDIILVAQGEMALEEFLKQVRESWQNYELELINYQNKCRLIRGWDDLFNKVKEHINSVAAMKLSPYYKVFEEEALTWEEKLNRINSLFDIWIDVQRRWVYLEGIFSSSADIKTLLPVETSRFQSISSEFLGLMKKVSKSPMVMDILNIPGVQRSLERLADLLGKIQKALGEYLERERNSFPRFYFVGDEDLLEIIGNSKNVARLQKHFKKMFAGVASIILNEDNTIVIGIASREGEEVIFQNPVSTINHPKINEWLSLVEKEMRVTLASSLASAVQDIKELKGEKMSSSALMSWCDKYQAQIIILAAQILWSEDVETALQEFQDNVGSNPLDRVLFQVESTLNVLADSVLQEQPLLRRKKLEHLINEFVHKRTVTRRLIYNNVSNPKAFEWLCEMRFYFDPKQIDVLQQLTIHMANAKFFYGFEYLGVQDRLVQTPLTDRCYLTMTQALESRLGGSPFGPAGTGKTESVKALGHQLGRFVLVFNCDETFDFQAMGRIFVGLCQVGAWGCFDEFNRLEERMLSAVSQQVQTIQEALKSQIEGKKDEGLCVELVGKQVKVSTDMAIFITMNPGYAGRSNLPDNLKKLFRSLAMTTPDRQLIAEVMLFSQGFRSAEKLACKIVPFFRLCDEQLSNQSHYDFGLRALKSVLISAGNVKRDRIQKIKEGMETRGERQIDEASIAENLPEQEILIQSVCETMVPKLVAEDIPLLFSLLSDVFPNVDYTRAEMKGLKHEIKKVCSEEYLVCGEGDELGGAWQEKVLQLYQICNLNHGLMMVGPSGSGKTSAWQVLLKALERYEGIEGVAHVIDPKAISKETLYGVLDPNTREWTDGLFTHILRKIIDNVRGEINKRQWIIFDGDVDPEWVENLNSVLDDNKLLTLPNGERLSLPPNVRIMFEVQDLKYATLATVSRCGMVWFSEDVLSTEMIFDNYLLRLKNIALDDGDEDNIVKKPIEKDDALSPTLSVQHEAANILHTFFSPDGLVVRCLEYSAKQEHIMDFTRLRALNSLFSMLNQSLRNILQYNHSHSDFPLPNEQVERYITKSLIYAILWSFTGDAKLKVRSDFGDFIRSFTTVPLPSQTNIPIIDFKVDIHGEWQPWSNKVPQIEVETHKVACPDVVVPTLDTVRHESLLYTWLAEHKPLVLCGPPGSGKTMTLFSALRALPDMEVVGLNFSSATTPELLLKTFDHYCEYRKTPNGVVLSPVQLGKWLVLFCDEINLPEMDNYGTQRVISFLRQLVEHKGFFRTSDQAWVSIERIQFVGACNPPTDPGRKPLSYRFLRHVPVIYVDYPGEVSLKQIYGTFTRAMLRLIPPLRGYSEPLTNAMVEFYLTSQERFTQDMQPHYVYSPREMTRWVRGICEAIRPLDNLSIDGLVRLWAHEALRLFQDRLVDDNERAWTNKTIDIVALKHFPCINRENALERPILYSNWLSKDYVPVSRQELRDYVRARLKVFYEEELDVPLVLFDEVLEHVLRIDRIFRQPQGHLLLIGVSGAGKTTLSRFVAWMNGLSVFQIKVHNKYTADDFDEDLRQVLRRSGCKDEKIAFILDESNVLDSSFLERMNTLLANGEVPGLFEGDEYTTLMTQCKEGAQREGLMLDSNEELYKWFTGQVMKNLHVVFTMNPSTDELKNRAATSPALFNRCVLNWFGDWSDNALFQVGKEFTNRIDLDNQHWKCPDYFPSTCSLLVGQATHRDAVINACVYVHQTLHKANTRLLKRGCRTMFITPRHYLDFINHFVKLYQEKRSDLEEQQLHLNVGLSKIAETVEQVEEMQKSLAVKSQELQAKNDAANAKLRQMVKDQQEAEKKKVQSQEIQQQLATQTVAINEKRDDVMADLAQVEPAVIDAQNAVKSIKKQHLVEVRSMANPPAIVKVALESICLLLGENASDWKSIRAVIMRDNFINTIVSNFSTENITDEVREKMKSRYLCNPEYNFEKVNRASMACGPMVKWAIAQIEYADMLKRVEPLREELYSLEQQAENNKCKGEEVKDLISQLEISIASYKEEYAQLISQAQAIKTDLENVQGKVDRSIALLKSLVIERERWEATSETFRSQMSTIIGDVLLSSAFLAYAGYFDQHYRQNLFTTWCQHLHSANLQFRPDIARTEYLSNPDERLRWQAHALPADELCTENAIMLKRFNRYPLIIDPSGQATEFLINEYKDRKITKTSFLDDSFRKNLESALRFGNPLLVQDVENYDPILNPVLNRELRRTGGRVLITLGDQDIDLSPSFVIFLSTRDPTVEFLPDICSRVTFVNFTVTRSSLQSQCLNQVLKTERPDIDEKRSDLLKLQGEFHLRLRQLEKSLLQALNDAKGKILDDDSVITTLETLKQEAADISKKVEETDKVIAEIETVSQQYLPLSQACSNIYFTMDSLNQIHFLYQYSLKMFLDIFTSVLTRNSKLSGVSDYVQRLSFITNDLFSVCYERVARGMLHNDRLTFALLLCRIHLKGIASGVTYDNEFTFFLRGKEGVLNVRIPHIPNLSSEQQEALVRLSTRLPAFRKLTDLIQNNSEFNSWLQSPTPETCVPKLWEEEKPCSLIGTAMNQLLIIQTFRPDRVIAAASLVVISVLGDSFMSAAETELEFSSVVENELQSSIPALLCSVPGFDASSRVDDLAAEFGKPIVSIAIGSAEGFSQADRAINTAVKAGRWVLLKNVHLAPQWLVQLEKKLHSLQPHHNFRLFLTMEINSKVPVNLLRAGRIFVFEPPPGIRANLLRTFSTVPASRMMKAPNERARLYFLLAWFHAIVQERLRYVPLGWAKHYEFNESDLRVACDTLDTWIETTAMGRTNLPPEKVPWDALITLMSQCIYGGKIDNDFDQRLLTSFLRKLFTSRSFEADFALVANVDGTLGNQRHITMPDGTRRDHFLKWIESLSDKQTPSWLGLPNNAEKVLLTTRGTNLVSKLLKMQQLEDEDELAYCNEESLDTCKEAESDGRPSWMKTLYNSASTWLQLLPKNLVILKRTVDNIKDPLYRYFEREVNSGSKLLQDVIHDLEDVVLICQGEKKQTNYHRTMLSELIKGILPVNWRRYTVPRGCTVIQWITDFSHRVSQLQEVSRLVSQSGAKEIKNFPVWLGGLFNPEAYITATRQCIAQANSWSLEELELDVFICNNDNTLPDNCSFAVTGLKLQGAQCKNNQLYLTSTIMTDLHVIMLRWIRCSSGETKKSKLALPVYLNSTRTELLFTVDLNIAPSQDPHSFYERGVAILTSTALN